MLKTTKTIKHSTETILSNIVKNMKRKYDRKTNRIGIDCQY